MWDCFLPKFTDPDSVRVAAYVCYDLACTFSVTNDTSHPLASLELMVLTFSFEDETLHILNVYHRVLNEPCTHNLLHILSHDLNPTIPTLVIGDFNTHSHIWSFPYSTISPWASELVNWFDNQGLELLNPPRVATWESGRNDRHPSVLDLALLNEAVAISRQISDLQISFQESLTSDHAALRLLWYPAESIAIVPPPTLTGYKVDDLYMDSWLKIFGPLPAPDIMDILSLDLAACQLHNDIDHTSSQVFSQRKAPDPCGVCWWNPDCDTALSGVYATSGQPKKVTIKNLRCVIVHSKRVWAHDFLHHTTSDNLWEAVAWRKGRSIKHIPPLLVAPLRLSDDIDEMTEAFKERFFLMDHTNINPFQDEDPVPLPPCTLSPITSDKIAAALSSTSNKSAPGLSGINYQLLKWAFRL